MAELSISPDVIRDALKDFVAAYEPTGAAATEVGTVVDAADGIAHVEGLPGVMANELVVFEDGTQGLALNLDEHEIGVVVLGDFAGIEAGQQVTRTGEVLSVPVGDGYLGRVVDPLGNAIDGLGDIASIGRRALELQAPGVMQRKSVHEPMQTGIKAIDAMIPIGRGQRQLIIGDRQTGKTAIAIDTIINQKANWESGDPTKQVRCIYVAIGQKGSTIASVRGALEEAGAEVVIATYNPSTGDESATIAHMEVVLERARAEGVSTVFFIGEAAYAQEVLFELGDEFTVLILNGDSTNRWKTDPPLGIEGAGTLLTNRSFTSSTDPAMADCLAIIEAGLGLEVRSVELLEEGEPNYWAATQSSCRLFELFRQIATAAGPDLTNESFAAATATLGPFSISGQPYNSLGPGKYDARDTLSLAEWDHGIGFWRAISEPVDVG